MTVPYNIDVSNFFKEVTIYNKKRKNNERKYENVYSKKWIYRIIQDDCSTDNNIVNCYGVMCVNPVALTCENMGRKFTRFVPCGVCPECVKDKQNEYVIRTVEESHKRDNIWFITLTYSDENVPVVFDDDMEIVDEVTGEVTIEAGLGGELKTLNNKDITDWKKRVRRSIEYHEGRKLDFGYLICGEYGPRTHRPHYHGMLIGLSDSDVNKFKEDWERNYGYTCFKKISRFMVDRVARYIAKYITKQKDLEFDYVKEGKVMKPRKITSRGYGIPVKKRFDMMRKDVLGDVISELDPDKLDINPLKLHREIEKISKKKHYKLNGREYKMPNYYWKKITYVKDPLTGKDRASELSKMVSKALQERVQKDFARKLIEMANGRNMAEDYEACVECARSVCASEKMERQTRAQTIIETNIAMFRKSRF